MEALPFFFIWWVSITQSFPRPQCKRARTICKYSEIGKYCLTFNALTARLAIPPRRSTQQKKRCSRRSMNDSRSRDIEPAPDSDLLSKLEPDLLPKHLAVIMDGNGRWAELRGLPRIAGHQEGIKSVRELISLSLELGIKILTIYAFSQENWNRPAQEITALRSEEHTSELQSPKEIVCRLL